MYIDYLYIYGVFVLRHDLCILFYIFSNEKCTYFIITVESQDII
jgi:hypothetical protein